jgi:hypothetical protein
MHIIAENPTVHAQLKYKLRIVSVFLHKEEGRYPYLRLSKLFTRILFNRLEKYLENNNIICPEQIGFKRGTKISDHIFSLKSLIDNFFKNNKYFLLVLWT